MAKKKKPLTWRGKPLYDYKCIDGEWLVGKYVPGTAGSISAKAPTRRAAAIKCRRKLDQMRDWFARTLQ